jgi:hypothetical protein
VEEGADTQILWNSALPIWKSRSCLNVRLADEWENASRSTSLREVAAPAVMVSNGSGLLKSLAGLVTALTRAASFSLRSVRVCSAAPAVAAAAAAHRLNTTA